MKPLVLGIFLLGSVLSELLATYTFTSMDGRTLEAELIAASESTVTIRRSFDNRTFTLELANLIPEDAAFVQAWAHRERVKEANPHVNKPGKSEIARWPRRLKPDNYEITIVREDNDTETYIYQTPHFEFRSNVKLARKVVREFSQIFESTLLAVVELPLELNAELPRDELFLTQIFETDGQYIAAGGMPNSAGVYFRESRKIMVPLRHLGVKKTSSAFTIDERQEINVLAHEITHQVTHEWLGKLPIWVSEGIAEYIEHVPYERGIFRFDHYEISEVLGRESPRLVRLETLMNMDHEHWNQNLAKSRRTAALNYHSAFVLFYYFCHFELDAANQPRSLYDYFRAVEAGKRSEETMGILLNGRSYEELEEAVQKAYRRANVKLMFSD